MEIIKKKIIKFYAEWCNPCKTYGPVVEKYAKENGFEFQSVDIDTDEGMKLCRTYGVRGVPTTVVERGYLIKKASGALNKQQLDELVSHGLV